ALPRAHVGDERRDLVLDEAVGDRDGALAIAHVPQRVAERQLPRIAGPVGGDQYGAAVRRDVVGVSEEHEVAVRTVLPRLAGEEVVAYAHAVLPRLLRHQVDDGPPAAEGDVAVVGDQPEGGRGDVDREVLL